VNAPAVGVVVMMGAVVHFFLSLNYA